METNQFSPNDIVKIVRSQNRPSESAEGWDLGKLAVVIRQATDLESDFLDFVEPETQGYVVKVNNSNTTQYIAMKLGYPQGEGYLVISSINLERVSDEKI